MGQQYGGLLQQAQDGSLQRALRAFLDDVDTAIQQAKVMPEAGGVAGSPARARMAGLNAAAAEVQRVREMLDVLQGMPLGEHNDVLMRRLLDLLGSEVCLPVAQLQTAEAGRGAELDAEQHQQLREAAADGGQAGHGLAVQPDGDSAGLAEALHSPGALCVCCSGAAAAAAAVPAQGGRAAEGERAVPAGEGAEGRQGELESRLLGLSIYAASAMPAHTPVSQSDAVAWSPYVSLSLIHAAS